MSDKRLKKIVFTALFTALTAAATMVIRIPVPGTNGYVNVGDTVIFVCAVLFGSAAAAVSGGVGSAMADLLTGYTHWAPFTLVIKALEGLVCALIARRGAKPGRASLFYPLGMIAGALFMAAGYFFGGAALYGSFAVSAASIPSNLIQGGVSIVLALGLSAALRAVKGSFFG